jgi:tetratricopeptide (TPR) repeat protein
VSAFLIWGFWTYKSLYPNLAKNYPSDQSMRFIKENLKGNMFNEFFVGGYIMYKLGPDIKTYIDGRTDMFLPSILPEYIKVAGDTKADDQTYMRNFTGLMDKYHVCWAILTTNRYSLSWRLSRLLGSDPNWQLVFFDDRAYIYVRKNNQNTTTLEKFGLRAITPQRKSLYLGTEKELATLEYEKMNALSPSATSINALGFLALQKGDLNYGKTLFDKALKINPEAAAPKMNLAELAAKDGDFETAIRLYKEAISNEPDRGLAYLRLGELIIQSGGNRDEAITIWRQGLEATPDEEILKKINADLLKNN